MLMKKMFASIEVGMITEFFINYSLDW